MKTHAMWLTASVLALGWSSLAGAQTTAAPTGPQAPSQPVGAATQSRSTANSGPQEVVVTAERRSTNLQQTAIAATVLTGADLAKKGVFTVDQLQFVSPSLTVNNFGQGDDFDIRGIGKGEHNTQTGTGVVTYRDGVASFPGYFAEEPYYDVADVEILRGPQGTFSGQNATGGAVIVNTQDPKINGGYTGYLLGHVGNYSDTGLQGAVNLPISDTLAARVAFNTEYRDSFYNITGLPKNDDTNLYWGSARLSLLWEPTSSLKVLFKTDYDYLDSGGYFGDALVSPTGGPNPTNHLFDIANNHKSVAIDQFVRSILKVDYIAPDGITFRSVSGYQRGRTAWQGDIDGNANPTPNYAIDEAVNETLWSQEFNVISPSKGPLTWVLGAYYQHNQYNFPTGQFDIGVPFGAVDEDLNGVNATHTYAVFGQASYDLPAGFQLQAGLRYSTWSTTNHVFFSVPEYDLLYPDFQRETGNNVTGKLTLNWNLDPNNFFYAFVATGAKPGGLNGALYFDNGLVPAPFRQEYVTDYEIGWKGRLFDNHIRTQLGAYYNDFQHFQVIIPLPDNPLQSTEENNPSGTKLYGIEASAQANFGDFSGTMGLGLEHSALGEVYAEDTRVGTSGSCNLENGPSTASCINLKGHPQTYAPNFTFNASVQYVFHLSGGDTLTPAVNFSYISHQWGTLFDNVAAGDYLATRRILGATLAWNHADYVVTLYGTNLTNDQYVSALLSPIRLAGAPRQFGVSVLKTF